MAADEPAACRSRVEGLDASDCCHQLPADWGLRRRLSSGLVTSHDSVTATVVDDLAEQLGGLGGAESARTAAGRYGESSALLHERQYRLAHRRQAALTSAIEQRHRRARCPRRPGPRHGPPIAEVEAGKGALGELLLASSALNSCPQHRGLGLKPRGRTHHGAEQRSIRLLVRRAFMGRAHSQLARFRGWCALGSNRAGRPTHEGGPGCHRNRPVPCSTV